MVESFFGQVPDTLLVHSIKETTMYFFKQYGGEHWKEYCRLYHEYTMTIKDALPDNIRPLLESYHDEGIDYITYHSDKRLEVCCRGNPVFYGVTKFSIPYKPLIKNTWLLEDDFVDIHLNELVVLKNPFRYVWSLMCNPGYRDTSFSEISIEFQDVGFNGMPMKRSANPLVPNRQHQEEVGKILEKPRKR